MTLTKVLKRHLSGNMSEKVTLSKTEYLVGYLEEDIQPLLDMIMKNYNLGRNMDKDIFSIRNEDIRIDFTPQLQRIIRVLCEEWKKNFEQEIELCWQNKEGQDEFLRVKRADMNLNLGGTQAVRSPAGGIIEQYKVTPKPEQMPEFQAAQSAAVDTAKAQVERDVNAPKLQSKIASQEAKLKNLEKTIDNAIKDSGFLTTGIMGQMTSGIGGTPAKNLAATLDTVKANMGFDELQEMRDNSPTGGALGQVAVQEIQYLQSVIASLDQAQSSEQLKRNLETIKAAKRESNKRIRYAYEQTYGTVKQGGNNATQVPLSKNELDYIAKRKRQGIDEATISNELQKGFANNKPKTVDQLPKKPGQPSVSNW
jgi:hypothetical protein